MATEWTTGCVRLRSLEQVAALSVVAAFVCVLLVGCMRIGFDDPGLAVGPGSDAPRSDGALDGPLDVLKVDAALDVLKADAALDVLKADVALDVLKADAAGDGPGVDSGVVLGTWVTVAKGTFTMGSPPSEPCRVNNEEQHLVTLTHGFEIQSMEVTGGQFSTLMGYYPSLFKSCGSTCPVENVTWYEAVAYCNKLSALSGHAQCFTCTGSGPSVTCQEAPAYTGKKIYSCPGYRLPTEAEWEVAYRAGTSTALYNGTTTTGNCACSPKDANADAISWYCGNAASTTHPVGQKQSNGWSLYDMAGNVEEWCHDYYQSDLGSSLIIDPLGIFQESLRVTRGGAYDDTVTAIRAARRSGNSPWLPYDNLGFRCLRSK